MTKELLEQYPDICAEIEAIERRLRTPVSDVVSGSHDEYPYTQRPVTIRGLPEASGGPERLERLKMQKCAIEQFILTLPNAKLRRIAALRAMHGHDWKTVAAIMGHKYSEATVKWQYYNLFK